MFGFRPMEPKDVPQVYQLVTKYLKQFDFHVVFSEEDVRHWLSPLDKVVYSYVVEENGRITDFISFYNLPSSVSGHPTYNDLKAAYLFYYAPKGMGQNEERNRDLIKDAMIVAQQAGFDVFNALELLHTHTVLEELKFGKGDGSLHFYLYNYRCKDIDPHQMGLVML